MLNQYEVVFICTPVLSEEQVKETVEKFQGIVTEAGGEIVNVENWGLKKLAYPIQKKSTGFYHLVEFNAAPALIAKMETEFRRDERIMRFQTVKLDKYAAAYSVKRRNKLNAKVEEGK